MDSLKKNDVMWKIESLEKAIKAGDKVEAMKIKGEIFDLMTPKA
jgi:small-conductance mechanosensitive channel